LGGKVSAKHSKMEMTVLTWRASWEYNLGHTSHLTHLQFTVALGTYLGI
jgi:hypothetical protein